LRHLQSYLQQVKDDRKRRGKRYALETILLPFFVAKLWWQNTICRIANRIQQHGVYWKEALGLKYVSFVCLPHHSTYRLVLTEEVGGKKLEHIMANQRTKKLLLHRQDTVIAINGKTIHVTIAAEDAFGLHLLLSICYRGKGRIVANDYQKKRKKTRLESCRSCRTVCICVTKWRSRVQCRPNLNYPPKLWHRRKFCVNRQR
jgi:hypothetical protein